ncbi:uncharacterized protein PHALS_01268 [Plasmopara halstedii]|uniref:Uncharacterized protein n=1 Tax=Plasmopara halstedii TaxID=4781 RepID=A0A0P1AV31_PLAHL|nr:uncharacterized protein PHALS_01268 [Plasmopara halstedii]CEG44945.1 hypothetical protein PHALS_01268 [Plasmopara halstedii]|eukprot:XP_024581314.1 hypothetical protein PHALS_01268 [Plasmopara halstedii]
MLLDAKEMLRREFELAKKREEKEQAIKASMRERGVQLVVEEETEDNVVVKAAVVAMKVTMAAEDSTKKEHWSSVSWVLLYCKEDGDKRDDYTELKKLENKLAFSVTMDGSAREVSLFLDSGARSHMTGGNIDFVE